MLSIPQNSVKIDTNFPAEKEPPLPESVYSNISVMTELLKKACETIKKKKEKESLPINVKKTITPAIKKLWNKEKFTGFPYHSTSFAAATVELEMDITLYREVIRSIKIVISSGKVMHLQSAQNSIKLAVQKVLQTLVKDEPLDCPDIKIAFIQSDENPKQIGEVIATDFRDKSITVVCSDNKLLRMGGINLYGQYRRFMTKGYIKRAVKIGDILE